MAAGAHSVGRKRGKDGGGPANSGEQFLPPGGANRRRSKGGSREEVEGFIDVARGTERWTGGGDRDGRNLGRVWRGQRLEVEDDPPDRWVPPVRFPLFLFSNSFHLYNF